MLQFTNEDVLANVTLPDASLAVGYAYRALARDAALVHQRQRSHLAGTRLSSLGGILPELGIAGAKVYVSAGGSNGFAVLLFSAEDGRLLVSMPGEAVTQLKGSVTSAIAAAALARADAQTLTLFGTGVQARAHIPALLGVRDLKRLLVVSRSSADDFIRWVRDRFEIAVNCVSADEGAREGDLIITATRAQTPVLRGAAARPGAFISAIGSSTLSAREIDEACVRAAGLVIVEWIPQARDEAGELVNVDWTKVRELGSVLTQGLEGVSPTASRLFKSVGIGLADVAVAAAAYAKISGQWDNFARVCASSEGA